VLRPLLSNSRRLAIVVTWVITATLAMAVLSFVAFVHGQASIFQAVLWPALLLLLAAWISPLVERLAIRDYMPKRKAKASRCEALVLCLSTPALPATVGAGDDGATKKLVRAQGMVSPSDYAPQAIASWYNGPLQFVSLERDLEAMAKGHRLSWEQSLRMIQHHSQGVATPANKARSLKRVYIVGSPGQGGSAILIPSFATLVRQYYGDTIQLFAVLSKDKVSADIRPLSPVGDGIGCQEVTAEEGVDFESYDHVYRAIATADRDRKKHGLKTMAIDITGGQKPTTVAAAIYTVSQTLEAQYVQTGDAKHVVSYDLHPVDRGAT